MANVKQKQYCNNPIKTLKMVHIKKKKKEPHGLWCKAPGPSAPGRDHWPQGRTGRNQEACMLFSTLPTEENSTLLLGAAQDSWILTSAELILDSTDVRESLIHSFYWPLSCKRSQESIGSMFTFRVFHFKNSVWRFNFFYQKNWWNDVLCILRLSFRASKDSARHFIPLIYGLMRLHDIISTSVWILCQ